MSNASDDVRKKMADPYTLGGFIPEIDRNGVKDGCCAATVSPHLGNFSFTSQDFEKFLHICCMDSSSPQISAILRNTCWSFYQRKCGLCKSLQSCAEIRKAPGSQIVLPHPIPSNLARCCRTSCQSVARRVTLCADGSLAVGGRGDERRRDDYVHMSRPSRVNELLWALRDLAQVGCPPFPIPHYPFCDLDSVTPKSSSKTDDLTRRDAATTRHETTGPGPVPGLTWTCHEMTLSTRGSNH